MKKILIVLAVLISNVVEAQFIKEKAINVQIGYGISGPSYSIDDIANNGFLLKENW